MGRCNVNYFYVLVAGHIDFQNGRDGKTHSLKRKYYILHDIEYVSTMVSAELGPCSIVKTEPLERSNESSQFENCALSV